MKEKFRQITSSYYRHSNGLVVAYDVTDINSFHNVKNWIKDVEHYASEEVIKILVGCKCDLVGERQVERAAGQALADEYST